LCKSRFVLYTFRMVLLPEYYVVYVLYFLKACGEVVHYYVGMTGVLKGQNDNVALWYRKRWHLWRPVAWLRDANASSLKLTIYFTGLPRASALVEEARVAADLFEQHGAKLVRGGPWCRRRLPDTDLKEIEAVAKCTSRTAVEALAARMPNSSLKGHLDGKAYNMKPSPALDAGIPGFAAEAFRGRPPVAFFAKPRASGRHPAGTKKASGRHRPGAKRTQWVWQAKVVCFGGSWHVLLVLSLRGASLSLHRSSAGD